MHTTLLQENHEEADTHLILHAIHTNAGTSSKPKCIPIHTIRQWLSSCVVKTLLSFHAGVTMHRTLPAILIRQPGRYSRIKLT